MVGIQYFVAITVFLYLVIFSIVTFAASKPSGFTLRLIPRDSPESPLYPGNLTQLQRVERLVNFSSAKAKVRRLHSTVNATFGDEKYLTFMQRQLHYYIAQMMIGTPPQTVYLMVDSGADLTWTQCEPCINCFPQETAIYDPRYSSTYQRLPCDDPRCNYNDMFTVFECVDDECVYSIEYGADIGPTNGMASLEQFRFLRDIHGNTIDFNIVFGCSNDNTNFWDFPQQNNLISGILGLNLAPASIATQLNNFFGGLFSYCIPPFEQDPLHMRPLLLRFGYDVIIPDGYVPTTHYFTFYGLFHYYVECLDVSIEDHHLGLPAGTFNTAPGSGFMIDSGTSFTILTTEAINGLNVYQWVLIALMRHYDYYHLVRVSDVDNPTKFQLCYWNRPRFNNFASLTFHFQGADYRIDARYMNIQYTDYGFFCPAILGAEGPSVLGAFHMQDVRIIHNRNLNAIQFYSTDCANDYI